ncbi:hypothetical protein KRMM14A1004_39830 [Krasilnikovia sp. MM14-A1004]
MLTAGQRGDSPQFIPVLEGIRVPRPIGRPRCRPERVLADKAYTSAASRGTATFRVPGAEATRPRAAPGRAGSTSGATTRAAVTATSQPGEASPTA